jgi:hypothetical protein
MSGEISGSNAAQDLKRSALAVAMVMLKELDEALPEKHGAQAVAGMLLQQKRTSNGSRALEAMADENIDSLLLAITSTIGRLLDAVDDKCSDGPLKPMLLFRIVEDLARDGYDIDCVLDFVRRAHAGAAEAESPLIPRSMDAIPPAFGDALAARRVARLR